MIKLHIGEAIIDLSNYIDYSSIVYSDTIDITKAHGGFTIPFIKMSAIAGLDMSRPLTPLTKLSLTVDGEITYWKLSEDKVIKVRKGANPLYRHEITMIEPTIDLTLRVLPDMTITQPKGTLDNYIYEINQIDNETTISDNIGAIPLETGYETTGVMIDNTLTTLSFIYGDSNNTSVINDNTLKEVREYEIGINYELYNIQYDAPRSTSPEASIEFTIYANGVEIYDFTETLSEAEVKTGFPTGKIYPKIKQSRRIFKYTPSAVDEVITVKAQTLGLRYDTVLEEEDDEIWITALNLNITTYEANVTNPKITMDEAVDKILLIINQAPKQLPSQEFSLDTATRNRIKDIVCPDMTFSGYTVYEALQELAWYVGAIVYIGEDDWNTIHFYFYDTNRTESNITYVDEVQQTLLNDYVTGYEINAQNVVKENTELYTHIDPSETGFISIRAEDIGAINDTNAIFETTLPVYYENKIIVKGLAFDMLDSLNATVSFADTVEWDITNFVVEQTKWRGLENTSSANSRSAVLNKGNTLYYTKGSKNIKNITYNDVILAPAWNTATPANYAIIEAILCQAQIENPTYHFNNNYKPDYDIYEFRARLYYMAYSNARVTVYKENADELNQAIRYFNEQSSINDMKRLGDTALKNVNRRGNPTSTYRGITTNVRNLIHLGMSNTKGEKLMAYNIAITPTIRYVVLEYSKYNPNISNYIKTPSEYRQWEVPNNDLVYRKDKYKEFMYISETDEAATFTIYDINQILANFKATPDGNKLTYAQLELDYDGLGYTEKIESTVDVLSFGTTTAIQIELKDNYSAGGKQVTGVAVGNVTQVRQSDTRYTDDFGRVENVKVSVYTTHTISDSDNYPDNNDVVANPESQLELVIKKDAREIWGLTQELIFKSVYSNIKVYSGMASFNGMVAKGESVQTQPFLLKKGYMPTENIDSTKLIQCAWISTVTVNELDTQFNSVPIGEYEGYVWVETKTMTPIFAVKTTAFDTSIVTNLAHQVYMFTSYGSTGAFYLVNLASTLALTDTIGIELSTQYEIDLEDTLIVESTSTENDFVFPIIDLSTNMTLSDTIDIELSTQYEIDLEDTLIVESTSTENDFVFPIIDLSTNMTLSDTIDIELSTQYEIDLADTLTVATVLNEYRSTNEVVNLSGTMALTDTIDIEQSTDVEIDLVNELFVTTVINSIKSNDYVIHLSTSMSLTDTIDIEQSTDYEQDLTDTLTLSTTMAEIKQGTEWEYIGTTGLATSTFQYYQSTSTCETSTQVKSWLTSNHPPQNYNTGKVVRVERFTSGMSPCSPQYYYYKTI